jgi:hypothetical protein
MKRDELHKSVREKFLFDGLSSVGKTYMALNITKLYAMNGKKVLYIDPEDGVQRELDSGIFDDLTDEQLGRIELIHANDIETYLKYMFGWSEEKHAGTQTVIFHYGVDYDLKVCDGLMTEIDMFKYRLTQKFIKQGYYVQGERQFSITNPDTFTLPYAFYSKVYDQLREGINMMMQHKYDIVATTHPFKDTAAHKALEQSIYARFDSVVKLNKVIMPQGTPSWSCTILKNRGKESPDKTNDLDSVTPILTYFVKKFGMDMKDGMKALRLEEPQV